MSETVGAFLKSKAGTLARWLQSEGNIVTVELDKLPPLQLTAFAQELRRRHLKPIEARDFAGPRVILNNDYKLIISSSDASTRELFNLRDDPAERRNLAEREPAVVEALEKQLREWQHSTLNSLTGVDYR